MTNTKLPVNATLEDAKKLLREEWEVGLDCPACTQFVKQYKKGITSSMAYSLILMYRYFETHPEEEYVHLGNYLTSLGLPNAITNTGDKTKLRYWGLIEGKVDVREDGSNRVGYWKITELGRQFVRGEVTVQEYAKLFNSKSYGLTGEPVTIQDTLGKSFNYDELMKS